MTNPTTTKPEDTTPAFEWNWRFVWKHYVDPPSRYQAIEIVEHIPTGNLKLKCFGGRSGGWTEVWIDKEDRASLAKALIGDPAPEESS